MLTSAELMLKRSLEDELTHIKLMINNQITPSASPEALLTVKQYVEARLAALS